jgi:PST family polysaccharide transporter
MDFLNASFFSDLASVVNIITTLVIGKFIAMKLGTEGMALFGQLYSFVLIVLVFGGGAFSQGLVKYVAEYISNNDEKQLQSVISTTFKASFLVSGSIGLLLIVFATQFSFWIFNSDKYPIVFIVFGLTLILNVANTLLISVVNGHKAYQQTNVLNMVSNLFSLLISLGFIYFYGTTGALLAVVVAPVFSLVYVLVVLRKSVWLKPTYFRQKWDQKQLKQLMHFAVLGLVSYALFPWSSIVIRSIIIDKVSLSAAGIYELVLRISGASLLFFSLTVTTYFIPKISSLKSQQEISTEIKSVYKMMVPIVAVVLLGIYLFKVFFILLLADAKFLDAQPLFKYQLIGDFFKVCAQIFSFALVARAKVWWVIGIDVMAIILQIGLTYFMVDWYGLQGAAMAYMVLFFLYFITFAILFLLKLIH